MKTLLHSRLLLVASLAVGMAFVATQVSAECSPSDRSTAEQSYSTAYQFVTANQWAEAIPSLNEAVKACPEHWESVELLAAAHMRVKEFNDAADWYERLVDGAYEGIIADVLPRILSPYGYVLLQNRDWERAEKVYEAILGSDPNNLEAHERLVYAYDRSGNRRKAIEHLEALFAMTEGAAQQDYAKKIGNAYKFLNDNENAKLWFDMAGGGSSGEFSIGLDHMKKKQWSEGADSFRGYLVGKPDNASAWRNLGLCLQQLGRMSEAVEAYQKALEIEPDRHAVARDLGFLYLDSAQYSKAGALAQTALDTWPAEDEYKDAMYYLMGKVLEKRDSNYEGAIAMFREARDDPYWGSRANSEIGRQNQLIEIRDKRQGGR